MNRRPGNPFEFGCGTVDIEGSRHLEAVCKEAFDADEQLERPFKHRDNEVACDLTTGTSTSSSSAPVWVV